MTLPGEPIIKREPLAVVYLSKVDPGIALPAYYSRLWLAVDINNVTAISGRSTFYSRMCENILIIYAERRRQQFENFNTYDGTSLYKLDCNIDNVLML